MILLETTDGGKDREVRLMSALCGIGVRGITFKEKDLRELLELNDEQLRDKLGHLMARFLPTSKLSKV